MRILIKYESSWRNSFLDGSNNEPLPRGGRTYVGSIKSMQKDINNYKKRDITHDTIMGILCRLIGDQKKLYQSRNDEKYGNFYFKDIEDKITFQDEPNITNEVVYLRNMSGNTDQKAFSGIIKADTPIFNSDYSKELWSVVYLNFEDLCRFIVEPSVPDLSIKPHPVSVVERLEQLSKEKSVTSEGLVGEAVKVLNSYFHDVVYADPKGNIKPSVLYCSALYLQIERLKSKYDVSGALSKNNCISGISKRMLTKKDFMKSHADCEQKKVWGNPYIAKERLAREGEIAHTLRKASGTLTINIDVDDMRAQELSGLIENAGVSSFYIGKKGLAYVSEMR
ncbi:type I-Fv CRISPR-associated protein Cas5fv [Seleniivibrio woodruffii]|uniref:type I-Fv CRISPR-associated protein Cas5fv n=1 Tax=Seleniivibrio woodruffii TaxID=1078050 RepID=UPI0024092020|nr:type I-Fv CRISPR-associated protein Cas5fv [Seleniivibrio woodruffii]